MLTKLIQILFGNKMKYLKNRKNSMAYSIPLYTGSLPPNHPLLLMETTTIRKTTKTPVTMPAASMIVLMGSSDGGLKSVRGKIIYL